MSYKVILTDTAMQDLREIAFWIADRSEDRETARRFVMELRNECRRLQDFPNAGAIPRDRVLKSAGYRFTVYKDYLIFYTVDEEKHSVNVLAIFNGRKDYLRVMRHFI